MEVHRSVVLNVGLSTVSCDASHPVRHILGMEAVTNLDKAASKTGRCWISMFWGLAGYYFICLMRPHFSNYFDYCYPFIKYSL